MSSILDQAKSTFRDYITSGVISSGLHDADKAEIIAIFQTIDSSIQALLTALSNSLVVSTKPILDTYTPTIGRVASVVFDGSNNGSYEGDGVRWVYKDPLAADSAADSASNAAASEAGALTAETGAQVALAAAEAAAAAITLLTASAPFSGTTAGSNAITLPVSVTSAAQVLLTLGGLMQAPSSYTVSGATLTLSETPPSGIVYVGFVMASSPIQTLPLASRSLFSDITATPAVEMGKWVTPAQVNQSMQLGGVPVALFNGASAYDLPSLIARHGLSPFDSPYFVNTAGADNTAAFNDILDRLKTGGGGCAILPPGPGGSDWAWGSNFEIPDTTPGCYLTIKGLGERARIKWLGTSGDAIVAGDASHPVYYISLENIYLYSPLVRTSGYDFNFKNVNIFRLTDITTDGSFGGFYGEALNSGYGTRVQFNLPNPTAGAGVSLYTDPSGSPRTDIVVWEELTVQAYNAGSYGMVVNGAENGVHTKAAYMLGTKRGLQLLSDSTTIVPSFCDFEGFETDRATDCSVVLDRCYRTEFRRADLSNTSGAMDVPYPQGGADGSTFQVNAGAVDTKVLGGRIGNTQRSAVAFAGDGLSLLGTTLDDASKAGVGNSPLIYATHGAKDLHVDHCRLLGFSRASYALQSESDASGIWLTNNGYRGVVTGVAAGTPSNYVTSNNQGI